MTGSQKNNDEVYDPALMEEDGKHNKELEWKFEEIDTSTNQALLTTCMMVWVHLSSVVLLHDSKQQCNAWPNVEVWIWSIFVGLLPIQVNFKVA